MMKTVTWGGIWPYLATPLTEDFRLNHAALSELIATVRTAGVHGICPLGSSGDFAYVSQALRSEMVRACIDQSGGLPVAAGVGGFTPKEALQQAQLYADMGVDGVIFMPQNFFRLSNREAKRFVSEFMSNTPIPSVLYLNPSVCHFTIDPMSLLDVTHYESFVAIKDASGTYDLFQRSHELMQENVAIFASSSVSLSATVLLGASGLMSGPACVLPAPMIRLLELCVKGEWDQALVLERSMFPILEVFRTRGPGVVRSLLRATGSQVGPSIPPLEELLSTDEAAALALVIDQVNASVGAGFSAN